MSSSDSFSITFNVNIPSSIIREYFDGLAKVETAKAKTTDKQKEIFTGFTDLCTKFLNSNKKDTESDKSDKSDTSDSENGPTGEGGPICDEDTGVCVVNVSPGKKEVKNSPSSATSATSGTSVNSGLPVDMVKQFETMFGGEGGQGGFGDIMKMLSPMLSGLNVQMTQPKSAESCKDPAADSSHQSMESNDDAKDSDLVRELREKTSE